MLRKGAADLRAGLTEQIQLGRLGDRAAAERDADILIVLLDGLIFNIAIGQQTAESATAILTAQLDLILR